jgi:hypothetical protein
VARTRRRVPGSDGRRARHQDIAEQVPLDLLGVISGLPWAGTIWRDRLSDAGAKDPFVSRMVRTLSIRTTVETCAGPPAMRGAIRGAKSGHLGWL